MKSAFALVTATLLPWTLAMPIDDIPSSDLETSVCGFLREPLAFWLFQRAAGSPDERRVAGMPGIEKLAFTTGDGRVLGGYALRVARAQGYLLVAQGNAMLADQVIGAFQVFRDAGLDVYLYDYRGYGLSQGKSRLRAFVSDYRELVTALNAGDYRRRYLYGLSMGGVILLNAVGSSDLYDAAVIDSSPSRVSPMGCPADYDPVRHLPADAGRLMFIVGLRDRVVTPFEMAEMTRVARDRGAHVLEGPEFAHPFQDASAEIHRRRMERVADFLRP